MFLNKFNIMHCVEKYYKKGLPYLRKYSQIKYDRLESRYDSVACSKRDKEDFEDEVNRKRKIPKPKKPRSKVFEITKIPKDNYIVDVPETENPTEYENPIQYPQLIESNNTNKFKSHIGNNIYEPEHEYKKRKPFSTKTKRKAHKRKYLNNKNQISLPTNDNANWTLDQQIADINGWNNLPTPKPSLPDFSKMTEDEKILYTLNKNKKNIEKEKKMKYAPYTPISEQEKYRKAHYHDRELEKFYRQGVSKKERELDEAANKLFNNQKRKKNG